MGINTKIPKCLSCNKRNATKVEPYGYLYCKVCRQKYRNIDKPTAAIEVVTESIREDRKIFKSDIIQPFHDSHLSKEYVEAYPERVKQMVREGNVTPEEIKKAKPVWGLDYYKTE